jgi:tetratricopeptide (TPR) repeat protein
MQFADDPHFTVAGITDWTAAGGHGNDASLRTSEALTRDIVDLQPDENFSSSRSCPEDERALQAAVASHAGSFKANHCLGLSELRSGNYAEAVQRLETAYHLSPANAENEYALAEACEKAGEPSRAREHFQNLSAHHRAGDMHRLAAEVDESLGDAVSAVHEFAAAVREDPSEQNYFAWGSELLYHRAVWQARDVFEQGARAWPKSARMLTALGAALFAGALYDDAAERLCQAAALDPDHPEPYLFMGRIEVAAPRPLPCVAEELAEFHQRHPNNALADYYYAMALWKQRAGSSDTPRQQQVVGLLHDAVAADPGCGEAWLELGNLQAQSGDYAGSIPLYARAVAVKPDLSEAYYRLGIAYDRTGEREKARDYFAQHDRIDKQQAAEVEKQRREIKQFVILSAGTSTSDAHPNH